MSGLQTAAERDADAAAQRLLMARDIADLKGEVAELRSDIKGLVMAWQNANFGVAVIKWLAAIIMAGSTLVYVLRHFGEGR
jgi:hypothetical protein